MGSFCPFLRVFVCEKSKGEKVVRMSPDVYIRHVRKRLGVPQGPIAQVLCITQSTLSAYETGRVPVPGAVVLWFRAIEGALDLLQRLPPNDQILRLQYLDPVSHQTIEIVQTPAQIILQNGVEQLYRLIVMRWAELSKTGVFPMK